MSEVILHVMYTVDEVDLTSIQMIDWQLTNKFL